VYFTGEARKIHPITPTAKEERTIPLYEDNLRKTCENICLRNLSANPQLSLGFLTVLLCKIRKLTMRAFQSKTILSRKKGNGESFPYFQVNFI
jgi:hypothetical protein